MGLRIADCGVQIDDVIAGRSDGCILTGDCLDIMADLPAGAVDMVFTDPPYGHNNNNGDLIHRWEEALGRGKNTAADARPIANDGPDPQFARWSLMLDEAVGFKQMIVWDKGGLGMGWHYRRSYETVLVGEKPGGPCKWYGGRRISNVVRIPKIIPRADQHPTEKPVALATAFIQWHTRPGDVVLDCFAGVGTTCEAAKRLGRRWIGIEIDEDFAAKARRRLASTPAPLFQAAAETQPADATLLEVQ